jgi:hypothetical protein
MARPRQFLEANTILGPPADSHPGDVALLPVRTNDATLVSCWELTLAEIEEIVETGVVWLRVWGRNTQPPVMVTGHKAEVLPG